MATPSAESLDVWLTEKLTSVSSDIDTDVFVTFIIGILDDEDDNEEKLESISGLLEGVMEPDTASDVSKSILDEWMVVSERNKQNEATNDIADKLSEVMKQQKIATVKEKQLTEEEKSRKAAILKHYGEVSDGEETDEDDDGESDRTEKQDSGGGSDGLLVKNVNKQTVEKNAKEARDKSKQESEKKKEKDKQERQAQKQKAEDRKQNEKKRTQKGERRR